MQRPQSLKCIRSETSFESFIYFTPPHCHIFPGSENMLESTGLGGIYLWYSSSGSAFFSVAQWRTLVAVSLFLVVSARYTSHMASLKK